MDPSKAKTDLVRVSISGFGGQIPGPCILKLFNPRVGYGVFYLIWLQDVDVSDVIPDLDPMCVTASSL